MNTHNPNIKRKPRRRGILAFTSLLSLPLAACAAAPQPLDTRPYFASALSMMLPIALLLVLGFWLLFRKHPAERKPALRSTLLIFMLFMVLQFLYLVLHEGGHSLVPLAGGMPVTLYAHPFFFAGYSRPLVESTVLYNILGSVTAASVGLLISLIFWKYRSPALLPLVMLFPFAALFDGLNVTGVMDGLSGDFLNVIRLTGLPVLPFVILGILIFCIGLVSLLSLLPLAGLDPRDNQALFVLPAAMFLISLLSFLVAVLVVPGSFINRQYSLGPDILLTASASIILYSIFGLLLAVLYLTLFRWLQPRLPPWLRNETVTLARKDLGLSAIGWAVSVVIGLIIVIH